MQKVSPRARADGFSLVELLIVVSVLAIVVAVALPQFVTARRLLRFNGLAREVTSELRYARQLAMSQRQVFRFRYDDAAKQLVIIDTQERGTTANPLLNNPDNDLVVKTITLEGAGVMAGDIVYDRPVASAPSTLPDGTSMTTLTNGAVEIVFQPDGSVLDANGNPSSAALFFHDGRFPEDSAFAVSVLGAGGRVRNWRYSRDANLYVY